MKLNSRGKFLLLVGVFVVPMVAAWMAYFGWRPAAHNNYGDLIPPAPLSHTAGVAFGAPYDFQTLRGKWVMVHAGPADCDSVCQNLLYLMRQTRIAQGREQSRIERVWVVAGEGAPAAEALTDQEGLIVWTPLAPAFLDQFPAQAGTRAHIYLIDPLGNLMLRFPAEPDAKRIMKDLKLLLKASQIG